MCNRNLYTIYTKRYLRTICNLLPQFDFMFATCIIIVFRFFKLQDIQTKQLTLANHNYYKCFPKERNDDWNLFQRLFKIIIRIRSVHRIYSLSHTFVCLQMWDLLMMRNQWNYTYDERVNDSSVCVEGINNTCYEVTEKAELKWGLLALVVVIFLTALGNLLVCLAVCWERRLQNMTNYFLMSLAIADFLVSIIVMPFGMVVEIYGVYKNNYLLSIYNVNRCFNITTCS